MRYRAQPADYGTDVYAGKAVALIRTAAAAQTPFFIYLSVYAPHAPATPAPRHDTLFANVKAPRPASFNEEDVSDKPAFIRNRPRLGPRAQTTIDELYRKRLQSLQAVDDAVQNLINTLQAVGQLERTFVVFASDNGFHMGQHRLQSGKQTAYEEDIHVPLMIRGPGVPAGRKVAHIAGNIDLAPTFAAMAGVAAPDFVDGRSLMPLIGATPPPVTSWRQAYLVEHWIEQGAPAAAGTEGLREPDDADQAEAAEPQRGRRGGRGEAPNAIPEYHGVRTAQFTYVEYVTGEREFYDLEKDPQQLNNVAAKTSADRLQSVSGQLKQLLACAGATCRER